MKHAKVVGFGLLAAFGTGAIGALTEACPDLLPKLPAILTAGLLAALGYWLKSPSEPKP